ncbi:hypothetical protein [Winogradskyella pacifica]|jgi:hypothetical protein|uniref:hypothetical protein n=1 Tax=Winogradskyella pacifica TaxID=664642 RepID=UPI0015CB81B2|nr:hypothetical protein [Winogradskyella pacifica]
MKISKTIRITYLLTLLIALLSCASKQHIVTEEEPIITQPKLLFLNFEITKLNDIKSVSLINQIKTDGKLKGHTSEDTKGDIGDLEYLILDKDLNQLEKHYIKNPLKKVIEFVNDSGNFEKKMLDLDRSEFSLKLQLKPKAEYIVINEITSEGITKLNTTKIE